MNKDGVNEYSSCSAYFESMRSAGYETVLQGSAQGGINIAKDATISLNKRSGLSETAVRSAMQAGASDQRLGVAALLGRIADSQGISNHIDAQSRLKVANDSVSPNTTDSGPPRLN